MSQDQSQIAFIQDRAAERITEILDALGMEYVERRDYVHAKCPVHGGDNERAWYWAHNSRHWRCMTQHCEESEVTGHSTSVYGLVRGVMSRTTGTRWGFTQAMTFVTQVLGLNGQRVDPETAQDVEVNRAIREYRKRLKNADNRRGLLLANVVSELQPDTHYYPGRGIPPETIARYHISYCNDPNKPFYSRAFFPILDETGRYVAGWTARTIHPRCAACKMWHAADMKCPPRNQQGIYEKWRHSAGFRAEKHLYNIWYARPFIAKTGVAVIVEGPGDTWSFEMAGVQNSVAMFGLSLSAFQRQMLQRAGALTLVFVTDNDRAGRDAQERLVKELNYYFRLYFVTPEDVKDVGEMKASQIDAQIKPLLESVSRAKVIRDGFRALDGGKSE